MIILCYYSDVTSLRTTTWHVDSSDNDDLASDSEMLLRQQLEASSNAEVLQLLATAAKRVWEELYVCKKPVRSTLMLDFFPLVLLRNLFKFNKVYCSEFLKFLMEKEQESIEICY